MCPHLTNLIPLYLSTPGTRRTSSVAYRGPIVGKSTGGRGKDRLATWREWTRHLRPLLASHLLQTTGPLAGNSSIGSSITSSLEDQNLVELSGPARSVSQPTVWHRLLFTFRRGVQDATRATLCLSRIIKRSLVDRSVTSL